MRTPWKMPWISIFSALLLVGCGQVPNQKAELPRVISEDGETRIVPLSVDNADADGDGAARGLRESRLTLASENDNPNDDNGRTEGTSIEEDPEENDEEVNNSNEEEQESGPQFFAYDSNTPIALGDMDGDNILELVRGEVRGELARVVVFTDGLTINFVPYPGFRGGVYVATGDVDGDGFDEVITGAGPSGGPHVKIFDVDTTTGIVTEKDQSFFPFPGFGGGVRVATIRFNPEDASESLLVAAGPGGGPHVKVLDAQTGAEKLGFMAYGDVSRPETLFGGGVFVASGDVNGDGREDIVTGAGAGGGPHVKIWDTTHHASTDPNVPRFSVLREFMAYDIHFRGGVRVATADINGDHKADVITGAGRRGGPHLRVFSEGLFTTIIVDAFIPTRTDTDSGIHVAAFDDPESPLVLISNPKSPLPYEEDERIQLGIPATSLPFTFRRCPDSRPALWGNRCLDVTECASLPHVSGLGHVVVAGEPGMDSVCTLAVPSSSPLYHNPVAQLEESCAEAGGRIGYTALTPEMEFIQCVSTEVCGPPPVMMPLIRVPFVQVADFCPLH